MENLLWLQAEESIKSKYKDIADMSVCGSRENYSLRFWDEATDDLHMAPEAYAPVGSEMLHY